METLAQRLENHWRTHPQQVAMHFWKGENVQAVTYADLWYGATRFAAAYQRQAVPVGAPVILLLQHSLDLPFAFWGAVLAGAVPSIMPFLTEKLQPGQYWERLQILFERTQPALVVTYPAFASALQTQLQLGAQQPPLLVTDELPLEAPDDFQPSAVQAQSIALLQHSSGTTGLQKGVALSHRAVLQHLKDYQKVLAMQADDVVVSWLPLYHDMGLIAGFLLPLCAGIPLVWLSPFEWVRAPHKLFQAITRHQATLCWLPNFAYNFCAQKIRPAQLAGCDLRSIRAFINCSEPTLFASHQQFAERFSAYGLKANTLQTCYGMAENVFAVCQSTLGQPVTVDWVHRTVLQSTQVAQIVDANHPQAQPILAAGPALPGVHVRVMRNEQPQAERGLGEIQLQSDCLLNEYFHNPSATAAAFTADGWYRTGDLGYCAAGDVYITGRQKDLLIIGGRNIYPHDLEAFANNVPGVTAGRVVAFSVLNDRAGTEDAILLVESTLSSDAWDALASQIQQYVTAQADVAVRIVAIKPPGWLLKTSSGKIARSANRERYLVEQQAALA